MKNISVREAERELETEVYLEEQKWWLPGRLHHEYLCHQMFVPVVTMGQKECDWAIHCGWREQSSPWSLHRKATAMESINPNLTCEEIQGLYQEVYQLQRLPGGSHCEGTMEEWLWEEILASITECLWLGMPLENEGEHPSSTPPQRDSQTEYHNSIHRTHKSLAARKWGQDDEMLAFSRDAHCKALAAATLLEERIERLGHSTSRQPSWSCWHFKSCWHSGSHCLRCRVCWGRDSELMSSQSDSNPEASLLVASHHRGMNSWERLVTQPLQTEVPGDLCPGEVAFTRRTSRILCQRGWGL